MLAESISLAASVVNLGAFACVCSEGRASSGGGGGGGGGEEWVNDGLLRLMLVAQELEEGVGYQVH